MNPPFSIPTPSSVHIQEFKKLYKERFNEGISDSESLQQLISLLTVVKYQHIERSRMKYSEDQDIIVSDTQTAIKVTDNERNAVDQLLKGMQVEISAE